MRGVCGRGAFLFLIKKGDEVLPLFQETLKKRNLMIIRKQQHKEIL